MTLEKTMMTAVLNLVSQDIADVLYPIQCNLPPVRTRRNRLTALRLVVHRQCFAINMMKRKTGITKIAEEKRMDEWREGRDKGRYTSEGGKRGRVPRRDGRGRRNGRKTVTLVKETSADR